MSSLNEYVRLLPYGYAPGNYMSKCFACEKVFPDMDKRATRCRPCAEAAFKDHEIERLRAEVAGLREDAARYRHMRNNSQFQSRNGPGLYWYLPRGLQGDEGEQLDAAIDAARKGEA